MTIYGDANAMEFYRIVTHKDFALRVKEVLAIIEKNPCLLSIDPRLKFFKTHLEFYGLRFPAPCESDYLNIPEIASSEIHQLKIMTNYFMSQPWHLYYEEKYAFFKQYYERIGAAFPTFDEAQNDYEEYRYSLPLPTTILEYAHNLTSWRFSLK